MVIYLKSLGARVEKKTYVPRWPCPSHSNGMLAKDFRFAALV